MTVREYDTVRFVRDVRDGETVYPEGTECELVDYREGDRHGWLEIGDWRDGEPVEDVAVIPVPLDALETVRRQMIHRRVNRHTGQAWWCVELDRALDGPAISRLVRQGLGRDLDPVDWYWTRRTGWPNLCVERPLVCFRTLKLARQFRDSEPSPASSRRTALLHKPS